ncbi:GLE1-like protein-domain-containing protein [Cladochytrium replicatum]|nr:GLE1-like protein-domain-containing protein [Cladochytrium replicatum]
MDRSFLLKSVAIKDPVQTLSDQFHNHVWQTVARKTAELETFNALKLSNDYNNGDDEDGPSNGRGVPPPLSMTSSELTNLRSLADGKALPSQTRALQTIAALRNKNEQLSQDIEKTIQISKEKEADARERALEALRKQEEERKRVEEQARLKREQDDAAARDRAETERRDAELREQAADKERADSEIRKAAKAAGSVSPKAWEAAVTYAEKLKEYEEVVKPSLKKNEAVMDWLSNRKRLVRKRVGQLTAEHEKIMEISNALSEALSESSGQSDQHYIWLMKKVSKQMILQAEKEVSVKIDMADPLATICITLMKAHSRFLDYLLASMQERCIYVVPRYIRRIQGQSDFSYFTSLGFHPRYPSCLQRGGAPNDDEDCGHEGCVQWEDEARYLERMCGIVALYSAITHSSVAGNPHGLKHGWSWLARICNMDPRKATPLLVRTFLEVSGQTLVRVYGNQGVKLVRSIYAMKMPANSFRETFRLHEYLKEKLGILNKNP